MLIDAYGRVQSRCEDEAVSTVTASLDMDKLTAFRQKFPVLKDRD